jgi:ATP-dependent DNA helicase RecQ
LFREAAGGPKGREPIDGGESLHPEPANPGTGDRPSLHTQRVHWFDGSLHRPGWRSFYATVGGSLRSIPDRRSADLANCWVAREERRDRVPADDGSTLMVVNALRKLLSRGVAPPMHPDAERAVLSLAGLGGQIAEPSAPGDVAPRLKRAPKFDTSDFLVPRGEAPTLESGLTDSDEERRFVEWLADRSSDAVRWLVPQFSLGGLVEAAGSLQADGAAGAANPPGLQRGDFLFAPVGSPPVVIEIDGGQHEEQVAVDDDRDRRLEAVGVPTIRVPTGELAAGEGPGLRAVEGLIAGIPAAPPALSPLVWGPIQAHRLVLAMCESIAGGFLRGDRWLVEVQDPTSVAVDVVGPYLELLGALDRLRGNGALAPATVSFVAGVRVTTYQRTEDRRYERTAGSGEDVTQIGAVDVRILLECRRTSCESLPDGDDVPTVVVRSTGVPVLMRDQFRIEHSRQDGLTSGGGAADRRSDIEVVLRAVFAKQRLLEGQFEAISSVLAGRDCAVLLPTGAGKSMIYQIGGLCLPGRTLVVDPLVALIEDQLEGLRDHGIDRALGISAGSLTKEAQDAYFVFVTPERFQRQSFRDSLIAGADVEPVNLAVIDEAHCVSEWGHDFRAAYLNFGRTLRSTCVGGLGVPPLLALTGTASRAVLTDVLFQLGIVDDHDHAIVRPASFDRPELSYQVLRCSAEDSDATLRRVLAAMPGRFGAVAAMFFEPTGDEDTYSGIVFVPTVNGWHGLDETMRTVKGPATAAVPYAGSPPKGTKYAEWNRRKRESTVAFRENQAPVIVTTKAFGMGIDKPNIRWTVHYGLPGSIEAFYQEVGRAGRDRRQAHNVLILSESDPERSRQLLGAGIDGAAGKSSPGRLRDDVGTALYFHNSSFPGVGKELDSLLEMFDLLESDRRVPIGGGRGADTKQRALHRLAVLGVVDDYCLEGGYSSTAAVVRRRDPGTEAIVRNLLEFVGRSQPGRLGAIRGAVDKSYGTPRDAVETCGRQLIGFVYDTIGQSRRRSLQEMWLLATEADGDSEVRRRILDYLTEGDIAPTVQGLAERREFSFADWVDHWAAVGAEADAREWRSVTARLLGSYPDHPGLLASRGLAEALLPEGNLAEFEQNLARSLNSARTRYQATPSDMDNAVLWLLGLFDPSESVSAVQQLLRRTRPESASFAAPIVDAARRAGAMSGRIDHWLEENWRRDPQIAVLRLASTLDWANDLAQAARAKYEAEGQTDEQR